MVGSHSHYGCHLLDVLVLLVPSVSLMIHYSYATKLHRLQVMTYQLLSGQMPFDDRRRPNSPALSVIWYASNHIMHVLSHVYVTL